MSNYVRGYMKNSCRSSRKTKSGTLIGQSERSWNRDCPSPKTCLLPGCKKKRNAEKRQSKQAALTNESLPATSNSLGISSLSESRYEQKSREEQVKRSQLLRKRMRDLPCYSDLTPVSTPPESPAKPIYLKPVGNRFSVWLALACFRLMSVFPVRYKLTDTRGDAVLVAILRTSLAIVFFGTLYLLLKAIALWSGILPPLN